MTNQAGPISRLAIASPVLAALGWVFLVGGSASYSEFSDLSVASAIFTITLAAVGISFVAGLASAVWALIQIRRGSRKLRGTWLALAGLLLSLGSGVLLLSAALVQRLCCAPPWTPA